MHAACQSDRNFEDSQNGGYLLALHANERASCLVLRGEYQNGTPWFTGKIRFEAGLSRRGLITVFSFDGLPIKCCERESSEMDFEKTPES